MIVAPPVGSRRRFWWHRFMDVGPAAARMDVPGSGVLSYAAVDVVVPVGRRFGDAVGELRRARCRRPRLGRHPRCRRHPGGHPSRLPDRRHGGPGHGRPGDDRLRDRPGDRGLLRRLGGRLDGARQAGREAGTVAGGSGRPHGHRGERPGHRRRRGRGPLTRGDALCGGHRQRPHPTGGEPAAGQGRRSQPARPDHGPEAVRDAGGSTRRRVGGAGDRIDGRLAGRVPDGCRGGDHGNRP